MYMAKFIQSKKDDKILAVCLLFHRITQVDEDEIGPDTNSSISPKDFEKLIVDLSNGYSPFSLKELVTRVIKKQKLPQNFFVVTFDDGYYDTWEIAYPILAKYNVPATVYITTGFVNNLTVSCEYQLAEWLKGQDKVHFEWEGKTYRWQFQTHEDRKACYLAVRKLIKPITPSRRRELLGRIIRDDTIHTTYNDLFMKWEHVIELGHSPLITVGAHTHSHPLLTSLSSQEIVAEIELSKNILENKLGASVSHFSYPYGAVDEEIKSHLRMLGFISGVTTVPRGISDYGIDVMAIPRVEITGERLVRYKTLPELIERCVYS